MSLNIGKDLEVTLGMDMRVFNCQIFFIRLTRLAIHTVIAFSDTNVHVSSFYLQDATISRFASYFRSSRFMLVHGTGDGK